MSRFRRITLRAVALAVIAYSSACAGIAAEPIHRLDPPTAGGLREGARVVTVTSLADSGSGTLREAVGLTIPRIVVFDVSGYIDLTTDLVIRSSFLTIAGQTAPSPGIVLRGGSLVVRAHDVRVEHIGIFPGSSGRDAVDVKRDGVAVVAIPGRDPDVRDVFLRNLSIGWATDENVSFAGGATGAARLESSIIAEALRFSSHPVAKRPDSLGHSMGLLAGPNAKDVAIVGNLFLSNGRRNPQIFGGSEAVVHNNVFWNFGQFAAQVALDEPDPVFLSYTDNLLVPGTDTSCKSFMVTLNKKQAKFLEGTKIFVDGNAVAETAGRKNCIIGPTSPDLKAVTQPLPPLELGGWKTVPTDDLLSFVQENAGMRPLDRHPIDRRLLSTMTDARIIDDPADVGGWPPVRPSERSGTPPIKGTIDGPAELSAIAAWLCDHTREVSASPSACD